MSDRTAEFDRTRLAYVTSENAFTFGIVPVVPLDMGLFLDHWGVFVKCAICGEVDHENRDDPTMFHTDWCPLKGQRTAAFARFDVDVCELFIGELRAGFPGT